MTTATDRLKKLFVTDPATAAHRARKLFVTNPMRMEVARFKSRFMRATPSVALNRSMLALVILGYLCILAMTFTARESLHIGVVFVIQMVLTFLAAIGASHGAIAGERDRRSWDLLQVAPITQGEIVVGKFLGVMAVVASLAVAALPFVVLGLIFYRQSMVPSPTAYDALLAFIVTLSSASTIAAFTIYLSARMRNANSTLVTSIGSVIGVLVVAPTLMAAVANHLTQKAIDLLFCWHPFWVLARILFPSDGFSQLGTHLYGWLNALFYAGLTWFFLDATIRHLNKKPSLFAGLIAAAVGRFNRNATE